MLQMNRDHHVDGPLQPRFWGIGVVILTPFFHWWAGQIDKHTHLCMAEAYKGNFLGIPIQ